MSAGVGLIPIVAFVYAAWFDGFVSRDPKAWADRVLMLLYIFVFVSSLASLAGRVLKMLRRLLHATVVKVCDVRGKLHVRQFSPTRETMLMENRLMP